MTTDLIDRLRAEAAGDDVSRHQKGLLYEAAAVLAAAIARIDDPDSGALQCQECAIGPELRTILTGPASTLNTYEPPAALSPFHTMRSGSITLYPCFCGAERDHLAPPMPTLAEVIARKRAAYEAMRAGA